MINPLNTISLSINDFKILKNKQIEDVIVFRVKLPENDSDKPESLKGRKAVVVKWTAQTGSATEVKVHSLVNGNPEFVRLFYAEEGVFTLSQLFPATEQTVIQGLIKKLNVIDTIITEQQKLYTFGMQQAVLVMECMDGNLEDRLPYLSFAARSAIKEPTSHIIDFALKKLEEIGYVHGDLEARNVFIRKNEAGEYRIKVGDFGKARLIKDTSFQQLDKKSSVMSIFDRKVRGRRTRTSRIDIKDEGDEGLELKVVQGPSPVKPKRPVRDRSKRSKFKRLVFSAELLGVSKQLAVSSSTGK